MKTRFGSVNCLRDWTACQFWSDRSIEWVRLLKQSVIPKTGFSINSGVSGLREFNDFEIGLGKPVKYLQVDVPINPGNSGVLFISVAN